MLFHASGSGVYNSGIQKCWHLLAPQSVRLASAAVQLSHPGRDMNQTRLIAAFRMCCVAWGGIKGGGARGAGLELEACLHAGALQLQFGRRAHPFSLQHSFAAGVVPAERCFTLIHLHLVTIRITVGCRCVRSPPVAVGMEVRARGVPQQHDSWSWTLRQLHGTPIAVLETDDGGTARIHEAEGKSVHLSTNSVEMEMRVSCAGSCLNSARLSTYAMLPTNVSSCVGTCRA